MPGTFAVDQVNTFSTMLLMAAGPKLEFGTSNQAVSKTGERRWELQCAATWQAENGMRPISEVITVSLTGGTNPGEVLTPGTPVEFEKLRVGVSSPEMRDNGNGRGPRVSGGRAWYSASAVRAVQPSTHRAASAEKAA
jgi:hypothetical protein